MEVDEFRLLHTIRHGWTISFRRTSQFVALPPPPPFVNALGGTEPLDAGEAAGKAITRRQRRAAGLDPDR